jgi:hypothetical protein
MRQSTLIASASVVATLAFCPQAWAQQSDECEWEPSRGQGQGEWFGQAVQYNIRRSTFPDGYSGDRIRRRIIAGARAWSRVRTRCRGDFDVPTVQFVYDSDTGRNANDTDDGESNVQFDPATQLGDDEFVLDPENCVVEIILACEVTEDAPGAADEPLATDIVFNDFSRGAAAGRRWWVRTGTPPANQYDLMTVATHEFGHSYGIGHTIAGEDADPEDDPAALRSQVMYPIINRGVSRRFLGLSDINGLCWRYC